MKQLKIYHKIFPRIFINNKGKKLDPYLNKKVECSISIGRQFISQTQNLICLRFVDVVKFNSIILDFGFWIYSYIFIFYRVLAKIQKMSLAFIFLNCKYVNMFKLRFKFWCFLIFFCNVPIFGIQWCMWRRLIELI